MPLATKRGAQLSMALCTRSSLAIGLPFYQFLAHPVRLLRPVLVGDVVADVVAVFKEPEFRVAADLRRDALALFRRHEAVAATLNDEHGATDALRYALQVELLQFFLGILFASGLEAMHHRFAADARAVAKVGSLVVGAAVFDGGFDARLESGGAHGELAAETDTHQAYAPGVYIRAAFQVVDGVSHGDFVIVAQGEVELHLTLSGAVDSQHCHAAPQEVIAVEVQFFFDGVETGTRMTTGGLGVCQGFLKTPGIVAPPS